MNLITVSKSFMSTASDHYMYSIFQVYYDDKHKLIRQDQAYTDNKKPVLNTNDPMSLITDFNYGKLKMASCIL